MLCKTFHEYLSEELKIDFFTGVPDSTLKEFCNYLASEIPGNKHVVAANEGNAIGLACGYYLATGSVPLIYMQNSGLGNCVNPLLSLVDKSIYGVPMLLMIGWRGEPGTKDEIQHYKQGMLTLPILETLKVPYEVISPADDIREKLRKMVGIAVRDNIPAAIVVKKNFFTKEHSDGFCETGLTRENAIKVLIENIPENDLIISSTGKISREAYECFKSHNKDIRRLFMSVGSMGHASQIALGVAVTRKDRRVFCFDGDGAALMHMGGMSTIASCMPENYRHIIFNNGVHDSVGGQPTSGVNVSFAQVAKGCGYKTAVYASCESSLKSAMQDFIDAKGPSLLEIKVLPGARKDLGRPNENFTALKVNFMKELRNNAC